MNEGQFIVPRGDERLCADDELYLVCPPQDINDVVSQLTTVKAPPLLPKQLIKQPLTRPQGSTTIHTHCTMNSGE